MTNIRRNVDFSAWILQWTARMISTGVVLFIALMAVGEGLIEREQKSSDPDNLFTGLVIGAFILAYLVAVVIAWFREKLGGTLLIILSMAAIIAFMATQKPHDYGVTLIIGAPFLVSGILFLWCWKRMHKAEAAAD